MKECRAKLRTRSGIGLIFVLLIAAILAVCASIIYLGYRQHMKNSRLLFDELTVTTAERVARECYILDLRTGGVTYYYDGIHRTVSDASTYKGKVNLTGYGRSYASENAHGETGAVGIPNKGEEDGGAQFLAVSIESDGTIHSRWQGPWLSGEDYALMTPEERERLTIDQLNQIDADLIYELGKEGMMTESEKDLAEPGEDLAEPGENLAEPGENLAESEKDLAESEPDPAAD